MNQRLLLFFAITLISQLNSGCRSFKPSIKDEVDMEMVLDEPDIKTVEPEIMDPNSQIDVVPQMVGNDRDEHGCIGTAGYTWSNLKNRCVQLFAEGIKLIPAGPNATDDLTTLILNSFLVFSNDQMHVELYMPNQKLPILFHQTSTENNESKWISDTYEIKLQENKYTVYQFSLPILSQE